MFATEEFIEASRKFVCVRLESFESKEHQDMVRKYLKGRFANTVFCVLSPDGNKRLSGSGRSPQMAFGLGRGGDARDNEAVLKRMAAIAAKYPAKGKGADAVVPDFHSFRQALNVASGDQRLLVWTVAGKRDLPRVKKTLQQVANHADALGRYHYDFAGSKDVAWSRVIEGDQLRTGIFIIRADEFGQKGRVVTELALASSAAQILGALGRANKGFAATEKRKVYSEHVEKGRRTGVKYQDNMPWGEDRDGDGKIDSRAERRQRRRQ